MLNIYTYTVGYIVHVKQSKEKTLMICSSSRVRPHKDISYFNSILKFQCLCDCTITVNNNLTGRICVSTCPWTGPVSFDVL